MTRALAPTPALLSVLLLSAAHAAARPPASLGLDVVEQELAPSVTVQEHANRVVEEYRVSNNLYMVKITPSAGAPYYLVDDTGSGDLEYRRNAGGRETRVPQWALFSW